MTDDRSGTLRAAAVGFACAAGYNSVVAIRDDLPGEPLGIQIPLSVRTGILVGWGAAVAPPWPMPVAALVAALRTSHQEDGSRSALACVGLGVAAIVGLLVEPNTYKAKSWTPATRGAVLLHLAASAALAGAGMWWLTSSPRFVAEKGRLGAR